MLLVDILEAAMQVSKWGNSLGVRLPKAIVEELNIEAGDELELARNAEGQYELRKIDRRKAFLAAISRFGFDLPEGYQFDRDEANSR
jgi:antitoxin MazE